MSLIENLKPGRLDPAVLAALPEGTIIASVTEHGESLWTKTYKITTQLNKSEVSYFLKCTDEESGGKYMMRGEYEAMSAIHSTSPGFCPKPTAHGILANSSDGYFFICEFLNMKGSPPSDKKEFCARLAHMHQSSQSPTGKFGFHVPTCNGFLPQKNDWESSWERFFAEGFKHCLRLEEEANGPCTEFEEMAPVFFDVVVPRLLRPLEEHIKPCLVHGDLWFGNTADVARTDGRKSAVIFDSSAFYAHNEYELGNWKPARNRLDLFINEYINHFPVSKPEEDFKDRISLYSMRFNLQAAILFPRAFHRGVAYREMVIDEMRNLVRKFSGHERTPHGKPNS